MKKVVFFAIAIFLFVACNTGKNVKDAIIAPNDTISYRYVRFDTCEVIITCNIDLNDTYDQKIKIKTDYSVSSMIMFLRNNNPSRAIKIRVKRTKNGWVIFNKFAEYYASKEPAPFTETDNPEINPL